MCVFCVVVFACAEEILFAGRFLFFFNDACIETVGLHEEATYVPFFNEYFVELLLEMSC